MDNLTKWRGKAKVVAYLDLILTSMGLLIVLFFAFVAGAATVAVGAGVTDHKTGEPVIHKTDQNAFLSILWIIVAILSVLSAIQLWAAIKLMSATEIGRDAVEALKMSEIWRNVTIIFLAIDIMSNVATGSLIIAGIALVIRGTFLYIVSNFISELKIILRPFSHLSQVTVKM